MTADIRTAPQAEGGCDKHRPVQHRDGKPPWCNACGLRRPVQPGSECLYFKAKGMHLYVGSKHGDVCHGCGKKYLKGDV